MCVFFSFFFFKLEKEKNLEGKFPSWGCVLSFHEYDIICSSVVEIDLNAYNE